MLSFLTNPLWIFLQLTAIVLFVGALVLSRRSLSSTMSRNGNVLATSHVLYGGATIACALFVGEIAAGVMVVVWVALGWAAPRVIWWWLREDGELDG